MLITTILLFAHTTFAEVNINTHGNSVGVGYNYGQINIVNTINITNEYKSNAEKELKAARKKLELLKTEKKRNMKEIQVMSSKINGLEQYIQALGQDKLALQQVLDEYQSKYGTLQNIKNNAAQLRDVDPVVRDLVAIELSQESKNVVVAEIANSTDTNRLMSILATLMRDTKSMNAKAKEEWNSNLKHMPFFLSVKLLDILATERQKLAANERNYQEDLKKMNVKHAMEWDKLKQKENLSTNARGEVTATDVLKMIDEIESK
jgi:hypothetical protein